LELDALGFDSFFERAFRALGRPDLEPARVAWSAHGSLDVWTRGGEHAAHLGGRLGHGSVDPSERPVVGDWVAIDSAAIVRARLARRTHFARQAAGGAAVAQVVAANVDTVFLMTDAGDDFNPRRIERYLVSAREGGAQPVLVLNKVDLCGPERLVEIFAAAERRAPGIAVVPIGARDGTGLDGLSRWLARGRTVAVVGSSGVGKSTLVNRLLGEDRVQTSAVRTSDGRGRHTTTRRELYRVAGGALVVDTPGMRELTPWGGADAADAAFADIATAATGCRFRDCAHDGEPGCAVLAAVRAGRIDPDRLENKKRLDRELAWAGRRRDERASRAEARRLGREYRRIQVDHARRRR
jgi:ribosome biogenesis GTPase